MFTSSSSSPIVYSLTPFSSLLSLFLFAPHILPSGNRHRKPLISLQDELDDLHLFHEAVSMATATSHGGSSKISHLGTINPKPKIVFLFLTSSDLVFAPLWQRFFESSNDDLFNVYIHADPVTKLSSPEWLIKANIIPAKTTARASPTLISAARRVMANAIIDDLFNLYFALSYIEILSEAPYLHNRYVARGDGMLLPEIPYDKFRVGSQFFVLAKRHVLLVLRERKLWRKFKLPCLDLDSCYPEEHYFPTLLSMADPKGSSHYTLTRVNWTDRADGHPHTYHSPELIHTLRKSNSSSNYSYFFARKFSPDCLKPLLEIADDVIFRD
ncbi:laccase-17-like [Hibiscus syriacus]|uniref:Laccase-17-like n=1 Tax=Hibiscus syriacus TaxID=106335 RepID=A0A6A2X6A9_HIBSY|nr:laccase-17-like [Hibiscus syriacus]